MSAETYYPRGDGCGSMGTKPRKGDHKNGRFRTEIGKQIAKSIEKNRDRAGGRRGYPGGSLSAGRYGWKLLGFRACQGAGIDHHLLRHRGLGAALCPLLGREGLVQNGRVRKYE